jgi:hypothetical protein
MRIQYLKGVQRSDYDGEGEPRPRYRREGMVISEYGTKEGVVVIIVVWVVRPTMLPLLTIHLVSLIIYVLVSLTNNAMGNTTGCLT